MSFGLVFLFVFFVLFPAWFLGAIRVFLYISDSAYSKISSALRYFIAWALSFLSIVTSFSVLIGIVEIFRQLKCYMARWNMTKEQAENTGNISILMEAGKDDRLKLIYAYVISPIWIAAETAGLMNALDRRIYEVVIQAPSHFLFRLCFGSYIPLMLYPTIIRFAFTRHGIKRGFDTYEHMVLSLLVSLALHFYMTGVLPYSSALTGTLAVYCVISYKADGYKEIPLILRCVLTVLTIAMAFFLHSLIKIEIARKSFVYILMWEAIVLCYALNSGKPKEPQSQPSEPTQPAPPDQPAELTATALALIGRPTLHNNEYLTPAMTQSRHEAERPFVKTLSAICHTDAERKALSRYFMLWKEFAVFVALSQVLKSDKALLAYTQIMLKERLNEGLPPDVLKKRVERMRTMSVTFTADYKISGSLEQSFLRTFRETLPDGLPELPYSESVGGYLHGIYRFIYGGLKGEYQELRERERV